MKRVRVKVAFGLFPVGRVLEPAAAYGEQLVRRGFCEWLPDEAPVAAANAPVNVVSPVLAAQGAPMASGLSGITKGRAHRKG